MDTEIQQIYETVRDVSKKYRYTKNKGLGVTKIDNVANEVLKNYGYQKSKCNSRYLWDFRNEVQKEIDAGRPVIMNIVGGYYVNHSITVCGYEIYKQQKSIGRWNHKATYHMIAVYDGWNSGVRYIDYNVFSRYRLASFNKIKMESVLRL